MTPIHLSLLCISLAAASAGPASAHVTLEEAQAPVGKPYKATLRVSHGCEGTATLADAHHDEFVLRGQLPAQPGPA
jgi:uncharacterized protein YcnI